MDLTRENIVVLTLLALIAVTYSSPSTPYTISNAPDPQQVVSIVSVGNFYKPTKSCQVIYNSIYGTKPVTYTPCKFSFKPDVLTSSVNGFPTPSSKFRFTMLSLSRSKLDALIQTQGIFSKSGDGFAYLNTGLKVLDYPYDDFDWITTYARTACSGVTTNYEVDLGNVFGCPSYSTTYPIDYCGDVARYGPCNCNGCSMGYSGSNVWTMRDKSNTVVMTLAPDHTITVSISDTDFFNQEAIKAKEIPSFLHYRELDCPALENYTMMTEEFQPGKAINQFAFRYTPNYFCSRFPVAVLDQDHQQYDSITTPLQQIVAEQTVTVPVNTIWRIDYFVKANKQLGLYCDPVNVSANDDGTCPKECVPAGGSKCTCFPTQESTNLSCTVKPGMIHLCTVGTWNGNIFGCAVQVINKCPIGTVEAKDILTGDTICNYFPPVAAVCKYNFTTYNSDTDRCEKLLLPEPICTRQDSNYRQTMDKCVYDRPKKLDCTNTEESESLRTITILENDKPVSIQVCGVTVSSGKTVTCPDGSDTNPEGTWHVSGTECYKVMNDLPCMTVGGTIRDGICYVTGSVTWDEECGDLAGASYRRYEDNLCAREPDLTYLPCDLGWGTSVDLCVNTPIYVTPDVCPQPDMVKSGNFCYTPPEKGIFCGPGETYIKAYDACQMMSSEEYCMKVAGRYDASTGICLKPTLDPSKQCPTGYSWDGTKCKIPLDETCEKGVLTTYSNGTKVCKVPLDVVEEKTPKVDNTQDQNTIYYLIGIILVLGYALYKNAKK
jgi:hypothetical protein